MKKNLDITWESQIRLLSSKGEAKKHGNEIYVYVNLIVDSYCHTHPERFQDKFNIDDFITFASEELTMYIINWKYNPLKEKQYPISSVEAFFAHELPKLKRRYFLMTTDRFIDKSHYDGELEPGDPINIFTIGQIEENIQTEMRQNVTCINIDTYIKKYVNRELFKTEMGYRNFVISLKLSLNKPYNVLYKLSDRFMNLLILYKNIVNKKVLDDIYEVDNADIMDGIYNSMKEVLFEKTFQN